MNIDDINQIKIGNINISAVYYQGELIWPKSLSYEIVVSSITIFYSNNESQILADGSNYAQAIGDVKVYQNNVLKTTLVGEVLTPVTLSGTYANQFYISNNTIRGYDREAISANIGTSSNPRGYYCSPTKFQYSGTSANVSNLTIQQQYNIVENSDYEDVYDAYEVELSDDELPATGGDITVTSNRAWYERTWTYTWTSGSNSYSEQYVGSTKNPTAITVTPSTGVQINVSQKKITFPVNTSSSDKNYSVKVSYTEDGITKYDDSNSVTVLQATIEYETPVITVSYPLVSGQSYHIPATGGTVYPTVNFSQRWKYSTDANYTNSRKMTCTITNGAQGGTASDGTQSVEVTMHYSGDNVNYGGVRAPHRHTDEYTDPVFAEVEVYATGGGNLTSNKPIVDVKQQSNVIVGTPEELNVSYYITGLSVVFRNGNGNTSTSAADIGDISYTECKKKYKERYTWTTEEKSTSDWLYDDITPTYTTDLSGASISGSTVRTSKRGKTDTSTINGNVTAHFGVNSTANYAIYQAGTQQGWSLTSNYVNGLLLHAYAETVTPVFTGTITYDNGDSGDTVPNPNVSFKSGSAITGRISYNGLTISSTNLGTNPYDPISTTFTYKWVIDNQIVDTTEILVTQEGNEPKTYGTLTLSASSTTIPASGTSSNIIFTPLCTATWTSGESGPVTTGYSYSITSYGNSGKRDYDLSDNQLSVGSLGKNKVTTIKTTTVRVSHTKAGNATVNLTEAKNEPSYGAIQVSTNTGSFNVNPSAYTLRFTVGCNISWDSNTPDSLNTSAFSFSWRSKGNTGYRSYVINEELDSNNRKVVEFGSLGTSIRSEKSSVLRVSHSDAGYQDITLTELENAMLGKTLNVSWDVSGSPISGNGGTARVFIDDATLVTSYSSNYPSSNSVDPEILLASIQCSGTGFSYDYTNGQEYGVVTATRNPSNVNSRSCTLTVEYSNASASTQVSQDAYVVVVVTQSYQLTGWSGQPTFGINTLTQDKYILECDGAILKVRFSSIASNAAGRRYRIRIDILGNGTTSIGGGTRYESEWYAIPSSSGTQYESMTSSFQFDKDEIEQYNFIRFRFSLEGASGEDLTMSGNYLDVDFNV